MATNETNLRNRPIAKEYADITAARGSGQLNSINAYLQSDPVSYFYQKFKETKNPYLRDDFWSEAAKRGESENLIALLNDTEKLDADKKTYDTLSGYGAKMDYDAYMLALQMPHLDNTKKVDRVDQATGVKFGEFTDREWADKIVTSMTGRWDAEIIEADKETHQFLAGLADVVGPVGTLAGGAVQFLGDVLNVGEGLLYMLVDWSNESNKMFFDNRGEKFIKAFANDEIGIADWLSNASYEFQRLYGSSVNAVEAYEEGYELGEGNNFVERVAQVTNAGAGYSTLGKGVNGIMQAIGYMLPTIILGAATGGASTGATTAGKVLAAAAKVRSGIFYTGIFSGMVKESVKAGTLDGTSYTDLNAGKIIANAALKSAAQYVVEMALAGIIGLSGIDRLIGIGATTATSKLGASVGTQVGKAAVQTGAKAVKQVVITGLRDALKEGLEETFQELTDIGIDYVFGADQDLDYRQRAIDKLTLQNLGDAFVLGALTSIVIGSVADMKVFVGASREVGVDADGKTFKMGAFQTLNVRQSLQTMQDWRDTINDEKATIEQKAKAMLALNAATTILGDVYKNMGSERAVVADSMIQDMLKMQNKAEQMKAVSAGVDYANKLWTTLMLNREVALVKYETEFKKAVKARTPALQKAGVDKVESVVTTTTTITGPESEPNLDSEVVSKMKALLDKLGVKVIVGVNGNVVLKSDEILFASNQLVETGDITEIVKGVAYDLALETVKANLNQSQINLVIASYNKLTGLNGSVDDAVKSLLFDSEFYTYMLLSMKERHYQNPAFEIMLTLDKLISAKLTTNVTAGTLAEKAYKTLLEKVRTTMRNGLVTFATSYAKLDLGMIDNAILPTELKQTITEHKNVRFTELINAGLKDRTNTMPAFDRGVEFDRAIAKFDTYITKEEVDELKKKARSTNYNDRVDAYTSLVLLAKNFDTSDKVTYLPAFASEAGIASPLITKTIDAVEKQFGAKWKDLIDGTYDPLMLTAEIKDLIALYGDMGDRASRYAIINHVLFHKSGKTFTLGSGGVLLQVVAKNNFAKDRYLGPKGDANLLADLQSGKVKTLKDVAKIPLDDRLSGITLKLDTTVLRAGVNGGHIDGESEIILSQNDTLNVIMHEVTHITQSFFSGNNEYISGGNTNMFNLMAPDQKKSLIEYIKTNFPMVHSYIGQNHGDVSVMYFLLAGEIQANTTMSSMMFECGFKWKDKTKMTLVSPDGKQEWSMAPAESSTTKAAKLVAKQAVEQQQVGVGQVNEDKPISLKKNLGIFNGKRFWSGSVNLIDGVIEETHTYEEAKASVFHHSLYFSETQIDKMSNEENAFFWVDNTDGTINGEWRENIEADIIEKIAKQIQIDKPTKKSNKLSEDKPITITELKDRLDKDPELREFVKDSIFTDKDGIPLVIYRGSEEINEQLPTNTASNKKTLQGRYYSTKPFVSSEFTKSGPKNGILQGYVTNLKKDDIVIIKVAGNNWKKVLYDGNTRSTDQIITSLVKKWKKPSDYKTIVFEHVIETNGEVGEAGTDFVIFDKTVLRRITDEDNGKYLSVVNKNHRDNIAKFQEFADNYMDDDNYTDDDNHWYMRAQAQSVLNGSVSLRHFVQDVAVKLGDSPFADGLLQYIRSNDGANFTIQTNVDNIIGLTDDSRLVLHDLQELYKLSNINETEFEYITDKYNKELAPLPAGLPKGLNTDEPLTLDALHELRDDPVTARRMKNAWLKRRDGTPLIFYRGWQSRYKNYEIHLAAEGNVPAGLKIGEFYSIHYKLAKTFGFESKIEGFIIPFTRKEIKVYNFNEQVWLDLYDYWTATDIEIHDRLFEVSRAFTTEVAVAKTFAMAAGKNIEPEITKRLEGPKLELWNLAIDNLMKDYEVNRDTAVTALAISATWEEGDNKISGHPNHYTTDALLPVNALQGYKAILMNNVDEILGEGVTTNLVVLRGASPIKVTHSKKDINWDKVIKPKTVRYISNTIAWKSNLKHFITKGVPIQMDTNVAAFVSNTTADFDKLPKVLQDKILKGTLNKFDIINFVATAKSMNDYTFQTIAKYIYHNEELAKMTFKEAMAIAEDISDLAALAVLVENPEATRTPEQLKQSIADVNKAATTDATLAAKLAKSQRVATSILVNGEYREMFPDQKQLLPIMMRHYNGSYTSIQHINNFGKLMARAQAEQRLIENIDTGNFAVATKQWNWVDKMRRADVEYEYDNTIEEALDDTSFDDKLVAIEDYITNELISRIQKMPKDEQKAKYPAIKAELDRSLEELAELSEEAVNRRYLAILSNETLKAGARKLETIVKVTPEEIAAQPRATKNIKDHIRQAGRTITLRIAGLKRRYNSMPKSVQEAIDPKTYKLKADYYTKMTDEQLETLLANLKETAKRLNASIKASETRAANLAKNEARLAKLAAKELAAKDTTTKKTLKEKVDYIHKTTIINQNFSFVSPVKITSAIEKMLETQWGKRTKSKVKGIVNNVEQNVHNGKTFFEQNAQILIGMSTAQAEEAVKWFLETNLVGVAADSPEAQTYAAIKTYFLGYVLGQTKSGKSTIKTVGENAGTTTTDVVGQFADFSANLKTRLEDHLRTQTTIAGTALAVWNNVQGLLNPIEVMMNASMEMAGVILTDTEKENLMLAAVSNDMDAIAAAQQAIIDRVNIEKTTKKTIWRKLTTLRSMAMLSNPITWLRNLTSNMLLKRLNKLASKIGSKLFTSKTAPSQFKMDGTITPLIQKFINDNFIDNKLFDTIVSKLSRYNPSDIQARFKDATGKTNKDAIFANMVIKSMYNEFYNQNLFNTPAMNKVHAFLMRQLSDNNYVREATVRYFGKIIAERGYSLATGVNDDIMNDFATAAGLAMSDYMHSDNFFNQIETMLAEKSEALLFFYKLILPFGSASWNWFKAAIRFSPIGLGQSIYKLATLEKQVIKAESDWAKGKGQISPELTEYLIRRNLGSGVIGTMSMILGMILSALGYVDLEDDDYGVPKLRIGNLRVDISTVFGSSSALAGMALMKTIMEKGDYMDVLDATMEPLLDGFFLVQILELDQYNNNGWATFILSFMEQSLLSFIPNGLRWLSGATYTGKYKTNTFFERAVARIPFFGSVFGLEKKVNPYTGDQGNAWDIFNRVVPFFSVRTTSAIEDNTKALGINKDELRGQYEINGEAFELDSEDVANLNKMYGQWNADDLVEFYDNRAKYSVKMENGTFRELTYSQMTETQRTNAVQNLFSKNAEYAKIYAWLMAGNAYYASATDYMELKRLGITGKLFKGTKGFVKA